MVKISPAQKIGIEIDGIQYELKKPSIAKVTQFEELIEEAKKDGGRKSTILFVDYIAECGLPKEVVMELTSDQLLEVYSELSKPKKND